MSMIGRKMAGAKAAGRGYARLAGGAADKRQGNYAHFRRLTYGPVRLDLGMAAIAAWARETKSMAARP